jgi:deoxyribonuclease V
MTATTTTSRRYGAIDVHYPEAGGATAALVVVADRRFADVRDEVVIHLTQAAPYQPGEFYRRELPPIHAVLTTAAQRLQLLVIDGYVTLDPDGKPGLGAHLHHDTGIPLIGVAKSVYRTATHAISVHRGRATRPLFVTAAGIPPQEAADLVTAMAGANRLPDALRRADTLART